MARAAAPALAACVTRLAQQHAIGVVLAEAGELPLYVRWLGRAARFWNSLLHQPADSLEHQALVASVQLAAEQRPGVQPGHWGPWAAQLAAAIRAVGVDFEPTQLQPLCPYALETAVLERHPQRVASATGHGCHTKLQHYANVRSGSLTADNYGPAAFLDEVRTVALRQPLAEVRAGSPVRRIGAGPTNGFRRLAGLVGQRLILAD